MKHRKYGLAGFPVQHSFSKDFFTKKFQQLAVDADFLLFENPSLNVVMDEILRVEGLKGFSVTKPFKEQIISRLDMLDKTAAAVGAVNCVKISRNKNGKPVFLEGYNTDITGFEFSLKKYLQPHHNQALILGTGGAAKAVAYVLEKLQIEYLFVTRTPTGCKHIRYSILHRQLMEEHTVIINATPLGMFPDTGSFPPLPYEYAGKNHLFFDLVYNPDKTLFLKKAEARGATIVNGLEMLYKQAEAAWEIWNARE